MTDRNRADRYDWLLAAGEAVQHGPQFLAASTILAIAQALTDLGHRAAILASDPGHDPMLVGRETIDRETIGRETMSGEAAGEVTVFRSARPAATLPALQVALGGPQVLCLPNQLEAHGLTRTPGLPLVAWLGEDDLPHLAMRRLPGRPVLLADSRPVAKVTETLTQQQVPVLTPPLTQTGIDCASVASAGGTPPSIATIGARPRDGIELVLQLAALRRDLRFIICEWPLLEDDVRATLFAAAHASGNVDWRRPANPSALTTVLAEADLILAPAAQLTGHRDWLMQAARLGRPVLRSDLIETGGAIAQNEHIVPAGAPVAAWLEALQRPLADAAHAPIRLEHQGRSLQGNQGLQENHREGHPGPVPTGNLPTALETVTRLLAHLEGMFPTSGRDR